MSVGRGRQRDGAAPFASGGSGIVVERLYGAVLLSCLLTGDAVTELGDQMVLESVRFQAGAMTSFGGILVAGRMPDGQQRTVSVSVYRKLAVAEGEPESARLFASYLSAAAYFWDDFMWGRRRLCLAIASPDASASQLQELTQIARAAVDEPAFRFMMRPTNASQSIRDQLFHVDAAVRSASVTAEAESADASPGALTWRGLGVRAVGGFGLAGAGAADRSTAVNRLRELIGDGTAASAEYVFSRLVDLADIYASAAAEVGRATLLKELSGTLPQMRAPNATVEPDKSRDKGVPGVRLDGAAGVRVGSGGVQFNYFYGSPVQAGGDGASPTPVPEAAEAEREEICADADSAIQSSRSTEATDDLDSERFVLDFNNTGTLIGQGILPILQDYENELARGLLDDYSFTESQFSLADPPEHELLCAQFREQGYRGYQRRVREIESWYISGTVKLLNMLFVDKKQSFYAWRSVYWFNKAVRHKHVALMRDGLPKENEPQGYGEDFSRGILEDYDEVDKFYGKPLILIDFWDPADMESLVKCFFPRDGYAGSWFSEHPQLPGPYFPDHYDPTEYYEFLIPQIMIRHLFIGTRLASDFRGFRIGAA